MTVSLEERAAGCDSRFPAIRNDLVVVTLATRHTGSSDEDSDAIAFRTRAGTTSDDGHPAMAVTSGERVVIVDVAIVISPVVATVEFVVASAGEPEQVVVAKETVLEKVIDFWE